MSPLAQRLLHHIHGHELLTAGDRVGIAVSGGIDSVALLRLMLELRQELGIVLSVVHFNHKLRGAESDTDQEFVAALARGHGLELFLDSGDAAQVAAEEHSGLEAAARELRYGFFQHLLGEEIPQGLNPALSAMGNGAAVSRVLSDPSRTPLNKIATGHTLDDQAETVLMRLIRGTGLRGLSAIYPRVVVEDEDGEACGEIVRPLLGIRRRELEQYLRDLDQPWREDATNSDEKFTRNRVRRMLLPLIEKEFNRTVAENLAELAEIARDEQDYWENEISGWLGTVVQWQQPDRSHEFVQIQLGVAPPEKSQDPRISLSRPWLLTEPKAVQRRVLKAIGEEAGIPLEFKHIEQILKFAHDAASGKELSLPLGWEIGRDDESIVFAPPDLHAEKSDEDYEYFLSVPGTVFISEVGAQMEVVRLTPEATAPEYNPQQLLRAEGLEPQLIVRNWRAGDRFWPAHTKQPKKVKELLQGKHVNGRERRLWPVIVSGDEIVWLRGFPVPQSRMAQSGEDAVLIRDLPPDDDEV
ncbi:MAG TPA: tRNA lysidine(34) synthetase TilS [Candidatus Binatia bacterium]|nr:tRNA lysidine(34) synthetase TilS [Candidatus Binatia bacterium]